MYVVKGPPSAGAEFLSELSARGVHWTSLVTGTSGPPPCRGIAMSTHDYRPHVTTVSTRAALGSVFSRDDAAAVAPRAEDARRSARLLTDEFEVDASRHLPRGG
jgi:hypothetical protein